jgi:hypothetical protein
VIVEFEKDDLEIGLETDLDAVYFDEGVIFELLIDVGIGLEIDLDAFSANPDVTRQWLA